MFVILRLAAALKSQYSISPVTRAKKISQQKTPFTDTGVGVGMRKLNPQKDKENVKKKSHCQSRNNEMKA